MGVVRHRLPAAVLAGALLLAACGADDPEPEAAPADSGETTDEETSGEEASPDDEGESSPGVAPGNGEEIVIAVDDTRALAVDAYLERYPDAPLRAELVDRAGLPAQVVLWNEAGSGHPDVVFAETEVQAALAEESRDYQLDLTEFIDPEIVDGFFDGANADCTFGDRLLCLRNDLAHNILWVNQPLLDELGFSVPETWEEYLEIGLAVGDDYMVGAFGDFQALNAYVWPSGCPAIQATSPTDLIIDVTEPECDRVSGLVDQLLDAGSLPRLGPFDETFIDRVRAGELLMFIGANWYGPFVFGTGEEATYPVEEGSLLAAPPLRWADEDVNWTGAQGGAAWSVFKDTANPELAADFVLFATTDPDLQADNPGFPAYGPASDTWGTAIAADPKYATDPIPVIRDAASLVEPNWAGAAVTFNAQQAFDQSAMASVLSGATLADSLPEFAQEITSLAEVGGYTVSEK